MADFNEGDKYQNPETGDVVELRGGRWQPVTPIDRKAPGASLLPQSFGAPDKSEAAYYRGYRKEDDIAQSQASKGVQSARRFEELISRQEGQKETTGGWLGIPGASFLNGLIDPEVREMDSLQAEQARQKRQPGEGAISDFDAQQFINMSPGPDKPLAVNRSIVQAQRIADDFVQQKRHFTDWYYSTFGDVVGAPEAWARYAQENPIFDPEKQTQGQIVFNPKRRQWREYFGAVRSDKDKRPTAPAEDAARAQRRAKNPVININGGRIE